jgi:hydroxymethylglutaryl-CoA lyase
MSENKVKIVEVGPRDGLQNEVCPISTEDKLTLIDHLVKAGLQHIEATSFVSPKWVPQMADHKELMVALLEKQSALSENGEKSANKANNAYAGVDFPVLVPNERGLEGALEAGAREIAVFAAASESFSKKNINASIAESLERFEPVMERAKQHDIKVRGYVSCIAGCPYEGEIAPNAVADVSKALYDMGCYEISLGDTIGTGTPNQVKLVIDQVVDKGIPIGHLALHAHDTYGQALANIYAAYQSGIRVFDASVGGLGGCPYAKGASGNVATENVVYMLQGMGVETGVCLEKLLHAAQFIYGILGHKQQSSVFCAMQGDL